MGSGTDEDEEEAAEDYTGDDPSDGVSAATRAQPRPICSLAYRSSAGISRLSLNSPRRERPIVSIPNL